MKVFLFIDNSDRDFELILSFLINYCIGPNIKLKLTSFPSDQDRSILYIDENIVEKKSGNFNYDTRNSMMNNFSSKFSFDNNDLIFSTFSIQNEKIIKEALRHIFKFYVSLQATKIVSNCNENYHLNNNKMSRKQFLWFSRDFQINLPIAVLTNIFISNSSLLNEMNFDNFFVQ